MKPLSNRGIVVAGVVWLILTFFFSGEVSCLQSRSYCGRSDLILASMVGVGFVVPSWFFSALLSGIFPSLTKKDD